MPIIKYKGSYEPFVFKNGVNYLVQLWGADGGDGMYEGKGGSGGYAYAKMRTNADTTWYFYVGGSPNSGGNNSGNATTGGWNGGGNAGAVGLPWGVNTVAQSEGYFDYYEIRYGGGGGGATDLRNSTCTSSVQSRKMLVAGGGGGGGGYGYPGGDAGWDGHMYPRAEDTYEYGDDYGTLKFVGCEGGRGATETAAGAGGRAPTYPNFRKVYDSDVNNYTLYCPSGGGGGGGYFGGGGGSSGTIHGYGYSYTGTAGGSGNANGIGGSGGSNTSSKTGNYPGNEGAGGGGGSDYYRDSQAFFLGGSTSMRLDRVPPARPINTQNGVASVYPVYSTPEIRSIYKDGNYIYVICGKSLDNNEEELFYIQGSSGTTEEDTVEIAGYNAIQEVIKDGRNVIKKYSIIQNTGDYIFTFSMNNGFNSAKQTYSYKVINKAPDISFNTNNLPKTVFQGSVLNDICNITLAHPEVNYRYETTLIINDEEYTTLSHSPESCTINLPYMFDGKNNSSYKLKFKARVCQTAQCPFGVGVEKWSNWVESEEISVITGKAVLNTLMFTTDFKNKAIEQATKLRVAWVDRIPDNTVEREYRLMLFRDGELIQSFDTLSTSKEVILDYPLNSCYKFGVSIVTNGVLSEIAYSDEFYLTNITSSSISFNNNLILTSNIAEDFDRFEVYINGDLRLITSENLNEQFPVVFFKNGNNEILVKTYVTETEYFPTNFALHIAYNESELVAAEKLDITSMISINSNEYEEIEMTGQELEPIDLCEAEKSMSISKVSNGRVIEEITQKITLVKIDRTSTDKLTLLEILGYIE